MRIGLDVTGYCEHRGADLGCLPDAVGRRGGGADEDATAGVERGWRDIHNNPIRFHEQ